MLGFDALRGTSRPANVSLVVDVTNQRQGGGVQVALGVLNGLHSQRQRDCVVLAVRGSQLEKQSVALGLQTVTVGAGTAERFLRYLILPRVVRRMKPASIYVVFGAAAMFGGRSTCIVGVAYANLFYPEVEFWKGESAAGKIKRRLRDEARLRGLRRADGWIFETRAVRERAVRHLGFDFSRTCVIAPPISPFLSHPVPLNRQIAPNAPRGVITVLLAASWHPNKNLDQLPAVAASLRDFGKACRFIITVDAESRGAIVLKEAARDLGLEDDLVFAGSIPQESMGLALEMADVVLLLSELESFSNNILEAFASRTPLVISDRDWAHSACGDGAIFVDPYEPAAVAQAIIRAADKDVKSALLAEADRVLLVNHKTASGRMIDVQRFIKAMHDLRA